MSRLTGREPRHWHDQRGAHRMPDPRKLELSRTYWMPDERAYADHLDEHDRLSTEPERQADDSPQVTALFDHIESLEAIIAKERLLIIALRQRDAQPVEADALAGEGS